jgi:hypothetical protein
MTVISLFRKSISRLKEQLFYAGVIFTIYKIPAHL